MGETALDRREFVKASTLAGAALASGIPASLGAAQTPARTFKLAYAPHFGMFRQHAGEKGLVAELEFMAAEAFRKTRRSTGSGTFWPPTSDL